jgi:glucose-6-phosphate dehydrogenase assembly protein OpcA
MIVGSADPDGPSWLEARVEAHCILPREGSPETCAEMIHVAAGGEAGRHVAAIVTPLLIHDLPVTIWWPDEPPLGLPGTLDMLAAADRLVVDGSTWTGDGLDRIRELAGLAETGRLAVSDFALVRQSRWREAIASIFDDPEFLPYLRSLRRIAVTYGTHDETGTIGFTNLVKPVYHIAWLASRLGLHVVRPLAAVSGPAKSRAGRAVRSTGAIQTAGRGLSATLSDGKSEVAVLVRPILSRMPAGTTLRVELLAERRGSELRADVTAEAETVHVRVWQDGVEALERRFRAPRLTEVDRLAEAIEAGGRDPVAAGALGSAAALAGAIGSRG